MKKAGVGDSLGFFFLLWDRGVGLYLVRILIKYKKADGFFPAVADMEHAAVSNSERSKIEKAVLAKLVGLGT
jgi:hypothetical protein